MLDRDLDEDLDPLSQSEGAVMGARSTGTNGSHGAEKHVPGSGWNNKKAQDDLNRAMESVIDQDFNLAEFGDPLLDAIMGDGNEDTRGQALKV